MCAFLVDYSNEHKKTKCVNQYVTATISHSEYKDVNKYLRNSINKIHSKYHTTGTYKIHKIWKAWMLT